MNLDYLIWIYFRENRLSPRQNITNRCHILIAETSGNLLAYALDGTSAKARWVGISKLSLLEGGFC